MNYNYLVTKAPVDGHYTYLTLEKIFQDNIFVKGKTEVYPPEYYSAGYAFYDFPELEKKIFTTFGEPKDTLSYYRHVFQDGKTKVEERAYIYENCILAMRCRLNCDPSPFGVEETVLPDEKLKDYLKLDMLSNGEDVSLVDKFNSLMSKVYEEKRKTSELSILCYTQMDGFYLKNVKTINKVDANIDLHYNDDFKEVSNHIIDRLNRNNDKGIVLLHGVPGTGKTSFLRQLTREIKEKNIIYIPPDFAINISNPDFITFLLEYENSILIIEDAENILKSRDSGGNQAVANLLNVSDGLLGDALKLQIVCTFNSSITTIDEALRREGRLIAEYKFDKLSKEKSQALINKVYENDTAPVITNKMTLAEIFNHKEKRFITKKDGAIGFNR